MEDLKSLVSSYLLDLSSVYKIPVNLVLLGERQFRLQWNDFSTNMCGWNKELLFQVIRELHAKREITVEVDGLKVDSSRELLFSEIDRMVFGIGKAGISKWCNSFRPNWPLYWCSRTFGDRTDDQCEHLVVVCGSLQHKNNLFASCISFFDYDPLYGMRSVRHGMIRNWKATYWKRLDFGYYFRVKVRIRGPEPLDVESAKKTTYNPVIDQDLHRENWSKPWKKSHNEICDQEREKESNENGSAGPFENK